MKLISARDSRAPAPLNTEKRAPAIFVARSKSRMPSAGPRSQCGCGSKSNARGSPWRRTSTLSAALLPTGTLACGRFGSTSSAGRRWCSTASSWNAELLDLLRPRAVGLLNRRRCRAPAASPARSRRPRCSARASVLRARESAAAAPSRASRSPRAPCRDRCRGCAGRCEPPRCGRGCTPDRACYLGRPLIFA